MNIKKESNLLDSLGTVFGRKDRLHFCLHTDGETDRQRNIIVKTIFLAHLMKLVQMKGTYFIYSKYVFDISWKK